MYVPSGWCKPRTCGLLFQVPPHWICYGGRGGSGDGRFTACIWTSVHILVESDCQQSVTLPHSFACQLDLGIPKRPRCGAADIVALLIRLRVCSQNWVNRPSPSLVLLVLFDVSLALLEGYLPSSILQVYCSACVYWSVLGFEREFLPLLPAFQICWGLASYCLWNYGTLLWMQVFSYQKWKIIIVETGESKWVFTLSHY